MFKFIQNFDELQIIIELNNFKWVKINIKGLEEKREKRTKSTGRIQDDKKKFQENQNIQEDETKENFKEINEKSFLLKQL